RGGRDRSKRTARVGFRQRLRRNARRFEHSARRRLWRKLQPHVRKVNPDGSRPSVLLDRQSSKRQEDDNAMFFDRLGVYRPWSRQMQRHNRQGLYGGVL